MSSDEIKVHISRLEELIRKLRPLAVAVSGGIDSMLLAYITNRVLGLESQMYHARSPAVPEDAVRRMADYSRKYYWNMMYIDATEFSDNDYLTNPVNRCYFCKSNLYGKIRKLTTYNIASGTNQDDMGDYRPGLKAAAENNVYHPFVECGINKRLIRNIAEYFSLTNLSRLPASPCLSSRVETGIRIDAACLSMIDDIETSIRRLIPTGNIRLRIRKAGPYIEIDEVQLKKQDLRVKNQILSMVNEKLTRNGFQGVVDIEPYRMGSTFIQQVSA